MTRVVVAGGGFAGMSAAARLAKLRHQVTLIEPAGQLGGQLLGVRIDGSRWYSQPPTTTLPGVLRDLFRKSGRTLERELELTTAAPRRHVFADGLSLDLPFGMRGDQHRAITEAFGEDRWSGWVDQFPDVWNVVRRAALDVVPQPSLDRPTRRALEIGGSSAKLSSTLADPHLEALATDELRLSGLKPSKTPGFGLITHWLERNFAVWKVEGGPATLAEVLASRLELRGVHTVAETALDVVSHDDGALRVTTDAGSHLAEVVVWACPTPPASIPWGRLREARPSLRSYLRLSREVAPSTDDIVLHSAAPGRLWHCEDDRWTIAHRGPDPWPALELLGIGPDDVDFSHTTSAEEVRSIGHPGWRWTGPKTFSRRPSSGPLEGLYFAGAHAHPGAGLEWAGMATSAIAADVGLA